MNKFHQNIELYDDPSLFASWLEVYKARRSEGKDKHNQPATFFEGLTPQSAHYKALALLRRVVEYIRETEKGPNGDTLSKEQVCHKMTESGGLKYLTAHKLDCFWQYIIWPPEISSPNARPDEETAKMNGSEDHLSGYDNRLSAALDNVTDENYKANKSKKCCVGTIAQALYLPVLLYPDEYPLEASPEYLHAIIYSRLQSESEGMKYNIHLTGDFNYDRDVVSSLFARYLRENPIEGTLVEKYAFFASKKGVKYVKNAHFYNSVIPKLFSSPVTLFHEALPFNVRSEFLKEFAEFLSHKDEYLK